MHTQSAKKMGYRLIPLVRGTICTPSPLKCFGIFPCSCWNIFGTRRSSPTFNFKSSNGSEKPHFVHLFIFTQPKSHYISFNYNWFYVNFLTGSKVVGKLQYLEDLVKPLKCNFWTDQRNLKIQRSKMVRISPQRL